MRMTHTPLSPGAEAGAMIVSSVELGMDGNGRGVIGTHVLIAHQLA